MEFPVQKKLLFPGIPDIEYRTQDTDDQPRRKRHGRELGYCNLRLRCYDHVVQGNTAWGRRIGDILKGQLGPAG